MEKIEFMKIIGEITERKVNKCAIEFENNPARVYYSGQLICGIVDLTLNEKKKVQDVSIKLLGKAYVCWPESNDQSNTAYDGKQIFFDKRIELNHESNDTIQLMPGSYKYTFEYKLPDSLPSSIEYKFGYIRYRVCVVVENLWSNNEEFDKYFTVIGVSNLTPYMREPVTTKNYKTFNLFGFLCCFPSDPLETVAQIPCCGYIPRQTIDLHLHVNNKSNQPVVEITVQLIQKIQYFTHAKSSTKTSDKIVLKQEYLRGCKAGGEKDIDVNILVPTVPPSQDTICNIIKIKYFIRILVSVPCCHSDPELHIPITIGSNPIQDNPPLPAWINLLANDFY